MVLGFRAVGLCSLGLRAFMALGGGRGLALVVRVSGLRFRVLGFRVFGLSGF